MNKLSILAVLVVFNMELVESPTYNCIKDEILKILVVDNSTQMNNNEKFCMLNNITYISMHGNKGLSKAYNIAIDNSENADVIVLLDDDTHIPKEYFSILREFLSSYPEVDIFAPITIGQDGVIYSPNKFSFLKNKLISSQSEEIPKEKFNAISSCLAIRKKVFNDYRFNEKLFVDQVDHNFFIDQRKLGRDFVVLPIAINQNFHQRANDISPEKGWLRLQVRIRDIFSHAQILGGKKYMFFALIKCCGLGLQMAKITNSPLVACKSIKLSFELLFHR